MTDADPSPPRVAFRHSALVSLGGGGVALVVLALGVRQGLGLSDLFLPKALAAYLAIAFTLLAHLPAEAPGRRFGPANQVTLARAVLAALLLAVVGEGPDGAGRLAWAAACAAAVAAALDGVDGWLARRTRTGSPFGARFDMETDALLVAALALLVWQLGKAGPWILAAGLLRYLFVAAGRVWPWMRRPLPPSRRRQAVCVVQVLTLIAALLPVLPPPSSEGVAAAGLAFLCYSFARDTAWLARGARRPTHEEPMP
jgi:phosphatidylglycerophosphate synthase